MMPEPDRSNILRERFREVFREVSDAQIVRPTQGAVGFFQEDAILLEPEEHQLRVAFAQNLFELFRAMAYLPGAELEQRQNLSRHVAFPGNPMFKGVWQTRLQDADVDNTILESIAWFRARQAPFFFWWLDPDAQPANLSERLQAHGFVPWEENAPGMAARLEHLDYGAMDRVPAGFEMECVRDEQGLQAFKQAFVSGMEVPEWAGQAWVDATLSFGIERAPWRCYVGRLNGQPVASNMLFCGAGVASVFGVATHPNARGQGIGAAITLIAYQEAMTLGYRHGVLFATESGAPVYRRIGFSDVHAGMSRYLWRAS